jgi:LuxR family maltose regulon positive regulatory protein
MIEEVETYLENPVVTRQNHSELVAVLLEYSIQRRNPAIARQILEEYHIQSIRVDDEIREAELLSLARYYEKTGEWKKLNDLAERLSPLLEERNHIDAFIQVQTLNAIAYFNTGRLAQAAQALTQALNRGAREGYLWTYVQYGAPILQVIALLATTTADEDAAFDIAYWGEITAVISKRLAQQSGQKKQNRIEKQALLHHLERMEEPLTSQERLVLCYLAGGNDNKGIAQELKVSNNTVKTHLANIYSKLGVHSRIEALNRAKALGLL